ncbi:GNAT family N-acetyltransferase [Pseudonocardia sp. CA-107938]|uniref:GNAT family N-acetyltransferase n=1 Tax=Pseudonocardia sp. CA-107938 TaxID=3240021 RepID=UPI003D93961F
MRELASEPSAPSLLAHRLTDDATLEALEPWQAAELAKFVAANKAHLDPWIPLGHVVHDEETAERFLRAYAERAARDDGRIYAIRSAGELVGGTVFRRFEYDRRTCEIGVWLAASATGRGLITLACRAMIDWAVHARGMLRVEWQANPANTASIAVARRLGMTREGVLRSASRLGDRQQDVEMWSILAEEWSSPQRLP